MDAATNWEDLLAGSERLKEAAAQYERSLTAEDYWWLGVSLAAITLADLQEKEYAVRRIQQLVDRMGRSGTGGDWFPSFLDELAALDAEGLLWPRYERDELGQMVPTGAAVNPAFDAEAGYVLALAHLAVAQALSRDDQAAIADLAQTISEIVQEGLRPAHRLRVQEALAGGADAEEP